MWRCVAGLMRTCPQPYRLPSMKMDENVDGRCKNELPSMKTHDSMDDTAPAAPIKDKSAVR